MMKANIEALLQSADEFAEMAESTGKATFISFQVKCNETICHLKEKEGELKSIRLQREK